MDLVDVVGYQIGDSHGGEGGMLGKCKIVGVSKFGKGWEVLLCSHCGYFCLAPAMCQALWLMSSNSMG